MLSGGVRLVCTDRGTHPSRELLLLDFVEDADRLEQLLAWPEMTEEQAHYVYMRECLVQMKPKRQKGAEAQQMVPTPGTAVKDRRRWARHCPTCRRDWQMTDENVWALVEDAVRSRFTPLPEVADLAEYCTLLAQIRDQRRVVIDLSHAPARLPGR